MQETQIPWILWMIIILGAVAVFWLFGRKKS